MKRIMLVLFGVGALLVGIIGQAGAIVGGQPDTTVRPWMGSMQDAATGAHGCGVSLIDPEWAVTAYHCVSQWQSTPEKVQIRFGSNDRTQGGILTHVERVVAPEGANVVGNDIALLKLTDRLDGVPLASLADVSPKVGSDVTMIGWGLTCSQSLPPLFYCGDAPVQIQTATVKLSPDLYCNSIGTGIVGDRELCVGSYFVGKAACYGDSGGPAIVGDKVVGVTSRQPHVFLYGNCYLAPAIYTDVSVHLPWIHSVIGH